MYMRILLKINKAKFYKLLDFFLVFGSLALHLARRRNILYGSYVLSNCDFVQQLPPARIQ